MTTYAVCHATKISTSGGLVATGNHNSREKGKDNIIEELSYLNKEYVRVGESWDVPVPDGRKPNYNDAFLARIEELPYYKDHAVYKNAVKAMEFVLSYSYNPSIDPYAWADQAVDWLHKTFDKAPDGKSNLLHCVLHMDEPGNPHIHAVIIPIDERGHLCAKSFLDGSRQLSDYQSSYANHVSSLGIERGLARSSAEHEKINRLYARLNNVSVKDIPKPRVNQDATEYWHEIKERVEELLISNYKEVDDYKKEARRQLDKERNDCFEAIHEEREAEIAYTTHFIKEEQKKFEELKKQEEQAKKHKDALERELKAVQEQILAYETVFQELRLTKDEVGEFADYKRGLKILKETNPEFVKEALQYIGHVSDVGRADYEAEKEQKREIEPSRER